MSAETDAQAFKSQIEFRVIICNEKPAAISKQLLSLSLIHGKQDLVVDLAPLFEIQYLNAKICRNERFIISKDSDESPITFDFMKIEGNKLVVKPLTPGVTKSYILMISGGSGKNDFIPLSVEIVNK